MTGQYKSKVICPDCNLESITFDPFTTVSLPIPDYATPGTLSYFVIFHNNRRQAVKMSFQYTKSDTKLWLETATKLLKAQPGDYKFYVLTMYENIYNFETTSKTEILHKTEAENKNIFLIELSQEEKNYKERVEIVMKFARPTYSDR